MKGPASAERAGGGWAALLAAAVAVPILALAAPAGAHLPSDSHLVLRASTAGLPGRWDGHRDVGLADLDGLLGLDADGDGALTWGELRRREADVSRRVLGRLALHTAGGGCQTSGGRLAVVHHSDGAYARLPLQVACPAGGDRLTVEDRLLFDRDPLHRAIVDLEGPRPATAVLSAEAPARTFALGAAGPGMAPASGPPSLLGFVGEGVIHIWRGLDHLLFLLALLLPAVLRREAACGRASGASGWVPVPALGPALADVARVVTAFTAAHSLTLVLAALGLVRVSARVIEPAIAASVVLAAANNLRPTLFPPSPSRGGGADGGRWLMAGALGLLHGFGFSSVLADVGLPADRLLPVLFGFNLGVELGQLAVVALFLPLAFFLRGRAGYRRLALTGGSLAIAAVALVWFVERVLDVSLIR